MAGFDPKYAVAIILGADEWPEFAKAGESLNGGMPFRGSAELGRAYFESDLGLGIKDDQILDLFNVNDSSADQIVQIEDFLARKSESFKREASRIKDLFLFFVGHGDTYGDQKDLLMLVRSSRPRSSMSGIQSQPLSEILKRRAPRCRHVVILDCCWSGAAIRAWQDTSPAEMIGQRVVNTLPQYGTTLICSSTKDMPSMAPTKHDTTLFSGAFFETLSRGSSLIQGDLSARTVANLTYDLMEERYDKASRPTVFGIERQHGDLSEKPYFPNKARRASELLKELRAGVPPRNVEVGIKKAIDTENDTKPSGTPPVEAEPPVLSPSLSTPAPQGAQRSWSSRIRDVGLGALVALTVVGLWFAGQRIFSITTNEQNINDSNKDQNISSSIADDSPAPLTPGELQLIPGETFTDGEGLPTMVVIPAGSFTMGSPTGEKERFDHEGPLQDIRFDQPFAMSQHEVTFAQWDLCVSYGECSHKPVDEWGRDDHPVMRVSWDDAQEYVDWINSRTDGGYSLPSEAQWEYAARAGTTTPFHTGEQIRADQANFRATETYGVSEPGEYQGKTVPVGSFDPNAFGLYDMHGNVWEWTQDCSSEDLSGHPSNGSANLDGSCDLRVLRGGSWGNDPGNLRSANRNRSTASRRFNSNGFRLLKTL